jgi:hypothetical protein
MRRVLISVSLALILLGNVTSVILSQRPAQTTIYYPAPGDAWQRKQPADVGFDPELLAQAVAFAKTQESRQPRDFSAQVETFGALLGPIPSSRAETNGIILRHGFIVAEWGDTAAVDPTYSVAKSFLSTVLGLTIDRRMIKSIDDPVRNYIKDGGYDSPHNSKITWRHHANQTSEWEGSMFGKSHDFIGVEQFGRGKREPRALKEPGEFYEYNDVRINRFSLSLLTLWKRPLPDVIKEYVMNPIGASNTWQYHGYRNSEVVIDGKKLISVSGARDGEVGCGSAPATRLDLVICSCVEESGETNRSCPKRGFSWPPHLVRWDPITDFCGGLTRSGSSGPQRRNELCRNWERKQHDMDRP